MILSLSLNAFYNNGDDYYFLDISKNGEIIKNSIHGYFTWDGRFLSFSWIFQQFLFKYFSVKMIFFFWSLCFLSSGFLLFKIIAIEFKETVIVFNEKLILTIFLAIIFWLGSLTHFAQTIYWATGGVYSLNLLIAVIWIIFFLKIQKERFSKTKKTCFLLYSILVGATTVNLSIGLITLILITIWTDFLMNKQVIQKVNIYILVFLITGFLLIFLAPGNFIRAEEVFQIGNNSELEKNIFSNFFLVLFTYLKWSSVLIFLAFLSGFIFLFFASRVIDLPRIKNFKSGFTILNLLHNFKWLLVGLSTISPFITMPSLASKRTVIYFMYFIFIFIVLSFLNFSKITRDKIEYLPKLKIKQNALLFFIASFLCFTFIFIGYNFKKGLVLKNHIEQRDNFLKRNNGKTVYLKKIDVKLNSFCFEFIDYKESPDENSNWIIEGLEDYYQVKKIIIE